MAKVLTLDTIIENGGYGSQVYIFKEYFGDSVEITEELCVKYYDVFDVDWFVDNILTEEQRKYYISIKYPIWEDYVAIDWPAMKNYINIKNNTPKNEHDILEAASEDYMAIQAAALKIYFIKTALAFCTAYNS